MWPKVLEWLVPLISGDVCDFSWYEAYCASVSFSNLSLGDPRGVVVS